MRTSLLLAIAACGTSPPPRHPSSITSEPVPTTATPFEGMTVIVDRACVPSGTYDATLELDGAEVATDGKTGRDRCVELAGAVAEHSQLAIDDALRVEWNGPREVTPVDGCVIAVAGLTIGFRNHKGHGSGDLVLGEGCTMKHVRIELRPVVAP